jgi:hypothetical protein
MGRRTPLIPEHERWVAVEDARGQWSVVAHESRTEPLRNADPYHRMMDTHLAASAPSLRAFSAAVLPRLEGSWATQDRRYRHLVDFGWSALISSRPAGGTLARILPVRGVLEIPLDRDWREDVA